MGFNAEIFFTQLFSVAYLNGAILSVGVAIFSLILATIIGFFVALARTTGKSIVRAPASVYVWFFRAIPALLVLLIMWNAMPQVFPILRENWYTPFIAAVIGLALVESAFMSEIIRSALMSVDEGQKLAGRALGISPLKVMTKITIPQAMRIALPPTSNEFIGLIKYSSLASVISLRELLTTAQVGVNITFRYVEYYTVAIIYYLVIVSAVTLLQGYIERKFLWTSKDAGKVSALKKLSGNRSLI
jgi:His/Glu/Gln/Arg/opine family amino acid ABC transporter permease subunit